MEKTFDTDTVMKLLWLHLVRDFRTVSGQEYNNQVEIKLGLSIKDFRDHNWPARSQAPVQLFKQEAQLENLFKRYRFKDDVYSNDDLLAISYKKFVDTQQRISSLSYEGPVFRILQRARLIAKEILGDYDIEEHMSLCRFGKRACKGTPYSRSYLDIKLGKACTGSAEHIKWFKDHYLPTDDILRRTLDGCAPNGAATFEMCEDLTLTFVPKSWKALRSVKPPSLIGSFYTYGLGRLIQSRLCNVDLDIRRLQQKHRRLVRKYSRNRRCVTADLSAASDSLTGPLLYKVLPLPWYRAIMYGFSPYVKFGDKRLRVFSVATMGDGHTFPLQTLVFYCLLRAIGELRGNTACELISVYGDDLIYPRELHTAVKTVFPRLGLILNRDKTYERDYFRESCGADCYRGCDVRPFSPEGEHAELQINMFRAWLYQLYNGLRDRWEECEIPGTLGFLQNTLLSLGLIHQVPPSYPDYAGIRVHSPSKDPMYLPVEWKGQYWQFTFIKVNLQYRAVNHVYPYYWDTMRIAATGEDLSPYESPLDNPILRWHKTRRPPLYIRGGITGRRYKRLIPYVVRKGHPKMKSESGPAHCWI